MLDRILPAALIATLLPFLLLAAPTPGMAEDGNAFRARLETENDFLVDDRDDLYSFGLGLEIGRGAYRFAFRETGFTDRDAGVRFDETFLTVGRNLALPAGWSAWVEAGAGHVGRGVFGQSFQNEFHGLVGSDEVELEYLDDEKTVGVAEIRLVRPRDVSPNVVAGPYLEASTTPGLKSHALLGARAAWTPGGPFDVIATAGLRWSHADLDELAPWMDGTVMQAEVRVVYRDRIELSWSTNSRGTGRNHLALGYRLGSGDFSFGRN